MPYDLEIEEFHETQKEQSYLAFHKKNFVSCSNVSIWKVLWEYLCWSLAGKPKHLEWETNERKNIRNT